MRNISSMTLSLCIASTSFGAMAQPAEFKCAAPGTVVEYSDGQRTTWVAQQGNTCRLRSKAPNGDETDTIWYVPTATVRVGASSTWADQVKPSTLWPLAVGKKLQGRYDGAGSDAGYSGSWISSITVEKTERLTTKAGAFDTFVVVFQQEGLPPNNFKSTLRQWYAPDPGVTVKFDYTDNRTQKRNGEAISIRR